MAVVLARRFAYAFPRERTALIAIDMRRDFLEPGGFGEALGNDVSRLGAAVAPVRALRQGARTA